MEDEEKTKQEEVGRAEDHREVLTPVKGEREGRLGRKSVCPTAAKL